MLKFFVVARIHVFKIIIKHSHFTFLFCFEYILRTANIIKRLHFFVKHVISLIIVDALGALTH